MNMLSYVAVLPLSI